MRREEAEGDEHERHGEKRGPRERVGERQGHQREQGETGDPDPHALRLERDTARQRHQEQQIAAEGVRLTLGPLERRGHPLPGRDLGGADDADDGAGQEGRDDEPPRLGAVAEVVRDHVIDDEVLHVLQHVEESTRPLYRAGEVPDERCEDAHGDIPKDRPVQLGLERQPQL